MMIPSYSLAPVFGISISEQRKIYFNHRNTLISLLSNTLNEHTHGLIRRFYPKGTDFNYVTHRRVAALEHLLNTRGRKSLGYRSPNEVFLTHLQAA
ncbi:hypothetical protein [Symbiopectobacterium purcellii]|uniref:hypothetical protein n=1 Tax=Symbiopectobacterium purcellii TaxID=2871826 RepID=UPI003F8442D2